MFLLNTNNTLVEYSKFLFDHFILKHFRAGASEVHSIFNQPTIKLFIRKDIEYARRDSLKSKGAIRQHQHISFIPESRTPQVWGNYMYISCRQCKCSIVQTIGLAFLQRGHLFLQPNQTLIIAGCFTGDGEDKAWMVHVGTSQPCAFNCNTIL